MPRESRTFVGGEPPATPLTPKHLTKAEFGRRVYGIMRRLGLHQAELARRAGLTRDAISTYVNGRVFPTPESLEKLANALGVAPEELLPNHTAEALENEANGFEMKTSAANPRQSWLRIDRLVSTTTAVRIAELLNNDVVD